MDKFRHAMVSIYIILLDPTVQYNRFLSLSRLLELGLGITSDSHSIRIKAIIQHIHMGEGPTRLQCHPRYVK